MNNSLAVKNSKMESIRLSPDEQENSIHMRMDENKRRSNNPEHQAKIRDVDNHHVDNHVDNHHVDNQYHENANLNSGNPLIYKSLKVDIPQVIIIIFIQFQ